MNQHNSVQNNNRNPVIISASDHHVIRKLIGSSTATSDEMTLVYELNRAIVVSKEEEVPVGTVRLDSTVSVLDLDTNKEKTFTIVIPSRADIKSGLVSILSPIGAALIGFRKGQVVVWHMPGGLKQLRITEVFHTLQKAKGE
jgi:regulator of nucleoside diphosphate kinase